MEVDRLRSEAEEKTAEKASQEEHLIDLNRRLADKDREKKGKSCVPSSCLNCMVGFVDQRLFLQIWRRRLGASEKKRSGSTRSVLAHWRSGARLTRSLRTRVGSWLVRAVSPFCDYAVFLFSRLY